METLTLIGMPGSGKSTVGVLLAKSLGLPFCDTDLIIQEREHRLLQEIIDQDGLEAFLDTEERAILSLSPRGVIATGGSAVLREKSMQHLKKEGPIVYLDVPEEELEHRIRNITTRGIAMHPGETLVDVYREREPLYQKWADITITVLHQTTEETVGQIVKALHRKKITL